MFAKIFVNGILRHDIVQLNRSAKSGDLFEIDGQELVVQTIGAMERVMTRVVDGRPETVTLTGINCIPKNESRGHYVEPLRVVTESR